MVLDGASREEAREAVQAAMAARVAGAAEVVAAAGVDGGATQK